MKLNGNQVISIIESNLRHIDGPLAGQPIRCLDFHREIIHEIYSDRDPDGRRNCTSYFLECGKGNAKSPLMVQLAIIEFLFNGPNWLVWSLALTYSQAFETTFNNARLYIQGSPTFSRMCKVGKKTIHGPDNCRWIVCPGDAADKGGPRPGTIIIDEFQAQKTGQLIAQAEAAHVKMSQQQPLLLVASNAGQPGTIAEQWHNRAIAYMNGENTGRFKGRVYGLKSDADWTDSTLYHLANPALGQTIELKALQERCELARIDPSIEFSFRQLNLGQWLGQSQTGFIDMQAWARCAGELPPDDELKKLPAFVSFDLSQDDDLTAVTIQWVGDRQIYTRTHHWLPKATAEDYAEHGRPEFLAWGETTALTLTEATTIDHTVKAELATYIEDLAERFDVQMVCYDTWRAFDLVQRLEQRIVCEPIKGTFEGLSEPTKELARRLRASTITIESNELLEFQARNLHVITNTTGEVRPTKQGAKGKFAGQRSQKIDGVVSIIIALARSMRVANALVTPSNTVISYVND